MDEVGKSIHFILETCKAEKVNECLLQNSGVVRIGMHGGNFPKKCALSEWFTSLELLYEDK